MMNSVVAATILILGYISTVHGHEFITSNVTWQSKEYIYYNELELQRSYPTVEDHPCKRECISGQSLICYYELIVHYYEAAGKICSLYNDEPDKRCIKADGVPTGIMIANGQLAGPIIEICINDTISLNVINNLREGTTIHWHGMHMKKSPHMDGSPYATQYPINPGESFRYKFQVTQDGTYWWHSHMSYQRAYGLAGPLVIRKPKKLDPHGHMYDTDWSEHIVFLQDWFYNYTFTEPTNILINGKGHNNKTQQHNEQINYERFKVVQGLRHRFRLIYNGNANCPVEVSIDNHELQVISSDGFDMEVLSAKSLVLLAAERYDIIVYASQPVGYYWMRVKGCGFCESLKIHQAAIIQYLGAPAHGVPRAKLSHAYKVNGIQFNPLDLDPSADSNQVTLLGVNSLSYTEWETDTKFKSYYTSLGIYDKDGFFGFQMDNIHFQSLPVSLLQARYLDIESSFCNKSSLREMGKDCTKELCKCFNVIQVPADEFIEFIISVETHKSHPFHPHGISCRVVGMGVLGPTDIKRIEEIDRATPLKRRLDKSSLIKDTIQVPPYGYVILRFFSNNPGYWMFHCHLTVHSENGMMAILKVGEHHQMVSSPRSNCCEDGLEGDDYDISK